jgi:hypothetical protein
MIPWRVKNSRAALFTGALALVLTGTHTAWCTPTIGQSAVITLVMPPGARATGLGEAFTGVANDVNAIFFNPAGLGMDPLANSWKTFLDRRGPFTAVAAKHKGELISSETVWAGTAKGVLRYNGRMWETHEIYLVEQGDEPKNIARRYVNVDDEKVIAEAAWNIRAENGIEMKRYAFITGKLRSRLADSLFVKAHTSAEALARQCLDLPSADRTPAKLYGLLSNEIDSLKADTLSDEIAVLLKTRDAELKDAVELRIPFTVAIHDSVTALAMDESERLWVGTPHGLWRTSESKWTRTTVAEGLPSNVITCIALGAYGELAVGTNQGIGIYKDGTWSKVTVANGLPDSIITSVSFGASGALYVGSAAGLVRKDSSSITRFDTSNGLISQRVNALFFDSRNRLWVGGENGVSIYTGSSWKRFKFPGSTVHCFTEQHSGTVWIGTTKGAVSHTDGKIIKSKTSDAADTLHEWKPYHSKNVLHGNTVHGLAAFGNDVWIATDEALNKYQWAQKQALLFYEPLLPAFKLKELWHTFGAFVLPTEEWGTIGISINFINMGMNTFVSETGVEGASVRSWEGIFGLSYGLPLSQTLSAGLNMKYVHSALAPGFNGAGVGKTFAIDAAILKRNLFIRNLNLGFMFQNMGPAVYYMDENQQDPIPFTLRLGTAYTAIQTPIHELTFLLDLNREVVRNYTDKKPDPFYVALWTDLLHNKDYTFNDQVQLINVNFGAEYWYSHFMALRTGFLGDYIGERYELTFGLGLNYGNMNFDWSYIYSPDGFLKPLLKKINPSKTGASGARNGQWRASFLFRL